MEYPRFTQFLENELPFAPLSPPLMPHGAYLTPSDMGFESFDDLSAPIDVNQSLPGMFSVLNISPAMQRGFSGGQTGSSGLVNEGLGQTLTGGRQRWWDDVEALRRQCCSGFDFDRKSYLESKKFEIGEKKLKILNENNVGFMMSVWCLKELRGRMYTMAKDQNGCRILQAMLERSTMEDVEIVLCELVNFVADLMKDQFGNYLVQKLVSMCNDGQKLRLVLSLIEAPADIILVCMNPHGTRAVQKLLESLNPNHVKLVMKALYSGAATLAVDPNGHHVIQYCLINFHSNINKPILTEIAKECYKIATDRSGCCVLQACVEHTRGELRTRILTEVISKSVHLAEDPFGNYVLQHMVGLNIPELTALLVRQLKGNFTALSCNKYASNVVEKCLNESGEEISTRIIMELVRSPNASMLLVDPYANFVIQSALKVSKGLALDCLFRLIAKNSPSMRTNLYGKKILEKLEKKRVNFA